MTIRIAFTEDQFQPLVSALGDKDETAAVATTSLVEVAATATIPTTTKADITLLTQAIAAIPETAYLERGPMGLTISSVGWVPSFRAAVAANQIPLFVHTHPGGEAKFSTYDDQVDRDLATVAQAFGANYYVAVVIAGTLDSPQAAARLYSLGGDFNAIAPTFTVVDAIRVTGSSMRLYLPPADSADDQSELTEENTSVFDRQVRMLGPEGDRTLKQVRAAIIGAGGTGTAVGVQIARLGLGEVVLVDDDVVTDPTPTRGHGTTRADIGRPKVDVLGDHLDAIGLGTKITKVNQPLNGREAIAAIAHMDVIFSCVDGHGARLLLNRWAYAHISPVIDVAVLVTPIETGSGRKAEIEQRVTWVAPGAACPPLPRTGRPRPGVRRAPRPRDPKAAGRRRLRAGRRDPAARGRHPHHQRRGARRYGVPASPDRPRTG